MHPTKATQTAMSQSDLFRNFLSRSIKFFLIYGAKCGFAIGWVFSVYSLSVFTLESIPFMVNNALTFGAAGAICGILVGILNGLVMFAVTRLFYQQHVFLYRVVTFLCFVVVSFLGTALYVVHISRPYSQNTTLTFLISAAAVVVATFLGGAFSQDMVGWYLQAKQAVSPQPDAVE